MSEPKEGIILASEEAFEEFVEALANITTQQLFRVRLVSTVDDNRRVCAISIGDRHWIAGPSACRAVADVVAESVTLSAISAPGQPDGYAPDETGIVQALRDAASRLEVKRLN